MSNTRLLLAAPLLAAMAKTAVAVGNGPRKVTVLLQYRDGLSIRPVNG